MVSDAEQDKQSIDYEAVLADLETRKAGLEQAISAIKRIIGDPGAPASFGSPVGSEQLEAPSTIASDTFFKMTIVAAVKKYLAMAKQPSGLTEVIAALERGGFVHDSENFYATVHSTLSRRQRQVGDLVRVQRKWALAEWYPARKRSTNNED